MIHYVTLMRGKKNFKQAYFDTLVVLTKKYVNDYKTFVMQFITILILNYSSIQCRFKITYYCCY